MKCPYCNKNHSDSAKFCEETGLTLIQMCENPKCEGKGKPLSINAKFCPYCGTSLNSVSNRQNENVKKKSPKEQQPNVKKDVTAETENKGREQKEEINQFSSESTVPCTPYNYNSYDDNDGCWSKGWKIATGIFSFIFGLIFWFHVIKSCS